MAQNFLTNEQTEKNVTSKDPYSLCARDLKFSISVCSKAIKYFKNGGHYKLEDTFRTVHHHADGTTYPNSRCKIDYIFARSGTQVESAEIDRKNYGPASDHWPINAIIKI